MPSVTSARAAHAGIQTLQMFVGGTSHCCVLNRYTRQELSYRGCLEPW